MWSRNYNHRLCLGILLVFVLSSQGLNAEITNVQTILTDDKNNGAHYSMTATGDWRQGNVSFLFLGVKPIFKFRRDRHFMGVLASGEYKHSRGKNLVSRHFEHVRHRYDLSPWLSIESFIQNSFDGIRRLSARRLAGMGPRLGLVNKKRSGLWLGLAAMLEYEQIKSDALQDASNQFTIIRLSSYATGFLNIDDRLQLTSTLYVQPRLTKFSDHRILFEGQLLYRLTHHLTLSLALRTTYDTQLPLTIEKFDSSLQNRLTLEF